MSYFTLGTPTIPPSGNLDTTYSDSVRVSTLTDGTAVLSGGFLSNVNDPVDVRDAANRQYVLDNASGDPGINRTWKTAVRLATTASITLFGTQTIDGILTSLNDRILVKDQSDSTQNGIYIVQTQTWNRAIDCPLGIQASGVGVFVITGSVNVNKMFVCQSVSSSSMILNFGSAITFVVYGQSMAGGANTQVQYNNSGNLAGSANMTWNGSVFSATEIDTNSLQSSNANTTVNAYISHQAPINIGGQTNSSQSLNLASYSGQISLGSLNGNSITALSVSGTNASTSSIIPASVSIVAGSVSNTGDQNAASVKIKSGAGNSTSAGGNVTFIANSGGASGAGGNVYVYGGTGGTSSVAGSIYITPGIGASATSQGSLYINGSGQTILLNSTNSTSTTSGSIILSGGLGVAKDIYCSNIFSTLNGPIALSDDNILVGNVSGFSAPVVVSQDATLSDTGILSLANVTTAGSFSSANVTIDAKGRVLLASNGAGPTATPPAGTNGQLQYNNNGVFGAASQWTYNTANKELDGTLLNNLGSSTIGNLLVSFATSPNMFVSSLTTSTATAAGVFVSGNATTLNYTTSNNVSSGITTTAFLTSATANVSSATFSTLNLSSSVAVPSATLTNVQLTNSTITSLVVTNASTSGIAVTNVTTSGIAVSGTTNVPSITSTNLNVSGITVTSLLATNISAGNLVVPSQNVALFTTSNLVTTRMTSTSLVSTSITASNLNVANNMFLPNVTVSNLSTGNAIQGPSTGASTPLRVYTTSGQVNLTSGGTTVYTIGNADYGFLTVLWGGTHFGTSFIYYGGRNGTSSNFITVLKDGIGFQSSVSWSLVSNSIVGTSSTNITATCSVLRIV